MGLDSLSRALQQGAVAHPRRTGRLARPAAEAEVDVLAEGAVESDPAFGGGAHQGDATAGGVHLGAEDLVGRTRRQAQPAMDALVELLPEAVGSEYRRGITQDLSILLAAAE